MKDTIVRGILWLGGANLVSQIVTWVATILVARFLTPADYGLIGLAGIYIGLAEQVNELGIGTAIIQKKELHHDDVRGIYTIAILFGFLMTAVSFLLAPILATFFKEAELVDIIRFLSFTFLINSAKSVQRNLMIRNMKFAELAKMEGGANIITSTCSLTLAYAGFGVWTLAIQYLLRNVILLFWAFRYEGILPGRIKDFNRLKGMLSFGLGVSGSSFLFSLNRNLDTLIVGKLLGKTTLGFYSFAQVLADKPFEKILSIFNQVFFPVFSKIQDDKKKSYEYLFRIMNIEIFIFTPIFVTLIAVAPELVFTVLGEKWNEMVLPLQVFSAIAIIKYIESRISMIFKSYGNSKPQMVYMSFLVPVLAMSLFLGAKYGGLSGVLMVWGGGYPLIHLLYLRYFLYRTGISWRAFLRVWQVPLFATVVMLLSVGLVSNDLAASTSMIFCLKTITAISIYGIVSFFFNKKVIFEFYDILRRNK